MDATNDTTKMTCISHYNQHNNTSQHQLITHSSYIDTRQKKQQHNFIHKYYVLFHLYIQTMKKSDH